MEFSARGNDSALWAKYGNPSFWDSWHSFGGKILEGTGPAEVGLIRGGYYDMPSFVIGMNHQLYGYVNTYWVPLGGYLTSSPAAASHSPDTIDVFALGNNGALWSRNTTNGWTSWNPWYEIA
jgi:hypothetical protein